MDIFLRLLLAHLLADFTFQTDYIADWKRRSRYGLLVHVLFHPLWMVALTWPFLGLTWAFGLSGWVCVTIITLIHYIEDGFRINKLNRGWPDNTLFFTFDQLIHLASLWLFSPRWQPIPITPWVLLGCLFVLVTHFSTVTFWFIERDVNGRDYPTAYEKYMTMAQRTVLWGSFLLSWPWNGIAAVASLVGFFPWMWPRRADFSRAGWMMGMGWTLTCGSLARWVVVSNP